MGRSLVLEPGLSGKLADVASRGAGGNINIIFLSPGVVITMSYES